MNHILIVESDVSTGRLMDWILAGEGYEVRVVPGPDEAVVSAEAEQPDVIILNTGLPVAEATTWIRRMHDCAPRAAVVDMVKAIHSAGHPADGARRLLVAPFDAETLVRTVRDAEAAPAA